MREFQIRSVPLYLLIMSSKVNDYYICDRGYIAYVPKDIVGEARQTLLKVNIRKPYYRHNQALIRIGGRNLNLKVELLKAFTNVKIETANQIVHKDGDYKNNRLNNLLFYTMAELAVLKAEQKNNRIIIVVRFQDNSVKKYHSYEEAAADLFVDVKTIRSAVHKKYKRPKKTALYGIVKSIVLIHSKNQKNQKSQSEIKK